MTFESVHPPPKSPSLFSLFNLEPFQKMSEWDIENKLEETGSLKLSTLSSKEVLMPSANRKSRQVATFSDSLHWLKHPSLTISLIHSLCSISAGHLEPAYFSKEKESFSPSTLYLQTGNRKLIFPLITVLWRLEGWWFHWAEEHNVKKWAEYRWIWTYYTAVSYA